jgi:hypothetical protein
MGQDGTRRRAGHKSGCSLCLTLASTSLQLAEVTVHNDGMEVGGFVHSAFSYVDHLGRQRHSENVVLGLGAQLIAGSLHRKNKFLVPASRWWCVGWDFAQPKDRSHNFLKMAGTV